MESIALYFTPLASTKMAAYLGLGLAYHTGVVYTNAGGRSYGVTAGPSKVTTPQTPRRALDAILDTRTNRPSAFGVLVADPNNDRPFIKGRAEDYHTQNETGDEYPHVVVVEGRDLSSTWRRIAQTYAEMGRLRLTYSPISQNSNSMAGTALRRAGIRIPFSSETRFAPATFNDLLRSNIRR